MHDAIKEIIMAFNVFSKTVSRIRKMTRECYIRSKWEMWIGELKGAADGIDKFSQIDFGTAARLEISIRLSLGLIKACRIP